MAVSANWGFLKKGLGGKFRVDPSKNYMAAARVSTP